MPNQSFYLPLKGERGGPRGRNGVPSPQGRPDCRGRIVKLFVGAGHGIIRMADGRDIYFHRGDLLDRTPFNDFALGDPVAFELLEDRFSGARALRVERCLLL